MVISVEHARAVVATVVDPEVPVLTLCDLGIVRDVQARNGGIEVVLTPTYSGCPATEVITSDVKKALADAGFAKVTVTHQRAPAWTTDWISAEGKRKLREYGIAPPSGTAALLGAAQPIHIRVKNIACPRCESSNTERLSAFGSTACKALYRCLACREPFEYFKPF